MSGLDPIAAAALVVATAALVTSRRRPLVTAGVAAVALLLAVVQGADAPAWGLIVAHGFLVGRHAPRATAIAGGLALAAVVAVQVASGFAPIPLLLTAVPAWLVGRAFHDRGLVAERLAARARELEAERDAYAQLSVRYERARIAAELHDIVAHAISVMVVQAAAGQRLAGVDPVLTAETFEAIKGAARQAEEDLDRLVDLLADRDPIGAAPDLRLIQDLVARAAGTGLDVSLELAGDREGMSAATVQTAYRVVQESLTNAIRYAAGSAVRIVVSGEPDELVVEVRNGAATRSGGLDGAGTGNGLRGLRERIGEHGGELDAGPTTAGGWAVVARLPRRAVARLA